MIQKFRFGTPIETCAVIEELPVTEGTLPFFEFINDSRTTDREEDNALSHSEFVYKLSDKDIVYGLGEQVRGINKRGWIYTSCNSDDPHHQEDIIVNAK